jgi:branched-chain amino acid transport system permease protein
MNNLAGGHWARFRHDRRTLWAAYALIAFALVALPFVVDATLGRTWVRIIDVALLFTMLALGLNIVVGYAGLLDLGYVAFFAVGAYCYALLASPQHAIHAPLLVLLPLGALVAAGFGVLLGAPTLKLRGDYLAIVTLGFGEIIRIFLNNLNRPYNLTNGPQGITLVDPLHIGDFALSKTYTLGGLTFAPVHNYYFVFLACAVLIMLVSVRLEDSRIGRAWIAIREDETAARAMGINTRNIKLLAFAMGATFGGISGGLFAAFQGLYQPGKFHPARFDHDPVHGRAGRNGPCSRRGARRDLADGATRSAALRRAVAKRLVRPRIHRPLRFAHAAVRPRTRAHDAVPSRRPVAVQGA